MSSSVSPSASISPSTSVSKSSSASTSQSSSPSPSEAPTILNLNNETPIPIKIGNLIRIKISKDPTIKIKIPA